MCGEDCKFRPLGFLLGLPFAFVSILISIVGIFVYAIGSLLSFFCPCCCCMCLTFIIELALGLIQAPFAVMMWFTNQIPC